MIKMDELQGKIALEVLSAVCPDEEIFYSHYITSASRSDVKFLDATKEKFKGEHFDIDGVYDMVGLGVTIIVYEVIKLLYEQFKGKVGEILKPHIDKVFDKCMSQKSKKVELSEDQKKRIKEIIEIVLNEEIQ